MPLRDHLHRLAPARIESGAGKFCFPARLGSHSAFPTLPAHAASRPPATARASGFGAISGLTTTRAYANIQALEAVHYQVKTRNVFLHLQGTQVAYGGAGMLVASISSGFCIHTSAKLL
jgi:hypothetical protein